jgi:hypothetical protein
MKGYETERTDGRVSIPSKGKSYFSPPQRPRRLWGPPKLLPNGYQGLFPRGLSSCGVKYTAYLHLVPKSRMVELYLHSPIRIHFAVLNFLIN